jgi:hypothetical protein
VAFHRRRTKSKTARRKDPFIPATPSTCAAVAVVLLDAAVGARYCAKLFRKQTYPRIATWLIFEIGVVMSLITYFTSHHHSLVKAALNLTDAAVVTAIVASILFEQRSWKVSFTRNEQLCLIIASVTLIFWMITKTAWVGLAGFQAVMSVAYFPTIESLSRRQPGPSPEPIETWSINAVAAFIGALVAVTGTHDYLAMLYPLRAFILCTLIVVLVIRWNRKNHAALSRAA